MSKPIGLCLIGAGAIAERHMQALSQLAGVEPRWVVSQPDQGARDFAVKWKFAQAGTSVDQALADPLVRLVLVSSPSPSHSQQAVQALQAGKDVIVEIPVAMNWSEAQRVAHAAKEYGRRVWVCHTMRSMAAMREVRERVRTGRLHLTQIAGFFGIPRRRNQGMGNIGTRTWIDNLLWHHGCHQIDAALWVLGMPAVSRVRGLFGPSHPKFGMELDVGVQMVAAGGELISQSLSYNVEQSIWRLLFIGHEDVLTFENGRLASESGEEIVPLPASTSDLTVQDREIVSSLLSGETTEFDLASILPTMDVLRQAQQSAEETP